MSQFINRRHVRCFYAFSHHVRVISLVLEHSIKLGHLRSHVPLEMHIIAMVRFPKLIFCCCKERLCLNPTAVISVLGENVFDVILCSFIIKWNGNHRIIYPFRVVRDFGSMCIMVLLPTNENSICTEWKYFYRSFWFCNVSMGNGYV